MGPRHRRRRGADGPLRRRRPLRGRPAGQGLRPGAGLERGQDHGVRGGGGREPAGPGLAALHLRRRRLRARAARPGAALHARQRGHPHPLRGRRPLPADDALGRPRQPRRRATWPSTSAGSASRAAPGRRPSATRSSSRARRRSASARRSGARWATRCCWPGCPSGARRSRSASGPAPHGGRRRPLRGGGPHLRRGRDVRPRPARGALRGGAGGRRRGRDPGGGLGHGPGGVPRGPALADRRLERRVGHDLRPPLQRAGRRPWSGLPVHPEPRRRPRRRRTHRHLLARPPTRWGGDPRRAARRRGLGRGGGPGPRADPATSA